MQIVVCGLSISSSWGNGHAVTYLALLPELAKCGHTIQFLERDLPWYAQNRDLPAPAFCELGLYQSLAELFERWGPTLRNADVVIVGSYVPDGDQVCHWVTQHCRGVTAFYDIDTPVTLAKLQRCDYQYLRPEQIRQFDLYLSFTGGKILDILKRKYGAVRPRPLYCAVDAKHYRPMPVAKRWDLAYLGTYSADRQPTLETLLLEPARQWPQGRFAVMGPQYPEHVQWPANVQRQEHLPPAEHAEFYGAQRFALNVTRQDMIRAGHCPSIRLFEAAACAVPIISDYWPGLESVFCIGDEIMLARDAAEMLRLLRETSELQRRACGARARARVLREHTGAHRALELEQYIAEVNRADVPTLPIPEAP